VVDIGAVSHPMLDMEAFAGLGQCDERGEKHKRATRLSQNHVRSALDRKQDRKSAVCGDTEAVLIR
jgi:hypothetical protein